MSTPEVKPAIGVAEERGFPLRALVIGLVAAFVVGAIAILSFSSTADQTASAGGGNVLVLAPVEESVSERPPLAPL